MVLHIIINISLLNTSLMGLYDSRYDICLYETDISLN